MSNPGQAIACGLGYVPEDRKLQGLFLELTTRANISTSSLRQVDRYGFINRKLESLLARDYIKSLSIKVSSEEQQVVNLSGGNQQKTLLARWLSIHPKILLLDDPTRGIDVGARAGIHDLIYRLAEEGLSVIFVSSELPEVMEVSDRILVLSRGQITGEFSHDEATKEKIMRCATQAKAAVYTD
jgi:ribose transport system ATP-binding protein